MRVRIYRRDDGRMDVFVEPSVGKGRPPVLLRGVTAENVAEQVGPVIEAMRRPKETGLA